MKKRACWIWKKNIIKWEKKGKDLESSFDKAKYQDVFRVSNFEAIKSWSKQKTDLNLLQNADLNIKSGKIIH